MTSLAQFFQNLRQNDTRIFNNDSDKEAIKIALAVLMSHIIAADKKITSEERQKIYGFFRLEFGMGTAETAELFDSIDRSLPEFAEQVDTLKAALAHDPKAKAQMCLHLNHLITCDGCDDAEYSVFNAIKTFII